MGHNAMLHVVTMSSSKPGHCGWCQTTLTNLAFNPSWLKDTWLSVEVTSTEIYLCNTSQRYKYILYYICYINVYLIYMLYTYFTALEVEWVPWSISRHLFLQEENAQKQQGSQNFHSGSTDGAQSAQTSRLLHNTCKRKVEMLLGCRIRMNRC